MAFTPRTTEEIAGQIWSDIVTRTNITANLDDSPLGMLVKIVSAKMSELEALYADSIKQANLTTATGAGLDLWGANIGVPRKQSQKATSIGSGRAIRFINNGGSPVTINEGTRVWCSRNPQLAFFTTEGITLGAGIYGEVHAIAADTGESFNVAVDTIDRHNYVGGSVSVTNIFPIDNGSLRESDDSYRSRIKSALQHRSVFNPSIAESLARQIPGVRDAVIINGRRNDGTFDCIVFPYVSTDVTNIVSKAEEIFTEYSPVGVSFKVYGPINRYVDVDAAITFKPGSESEREGVRENIRQQIANFIDNLPIETGSGAGGFYPGQIETIIRGASLSIVNANVLVKVDGVRVAPSELVNLTIGEKFTTRLVSIR